MKKPIFWKIFGSQLLIILLMSALILILSFHSIRSFHQDTLQRNLERVGESLKISIVPMLAEGKIDELDELIKTTGKRIQVRITVIRNNGEVLADSAEDPIVMEDHQFRPEILRALGGEVGRSFRFSRTVQKKMFYVGIPVMRGEGVSEVMRLSVYADDMQGLLSTIRSDIAVIVGVMVLLSMAAVLILSRSISRPIHVLTEASRRIAAGDFESKVFLSRKDEMGELAESYNFMTEHISRLFSDLTRQHDELNTVLDAMLEGLVVLDAQGRIRLHNRSFKMIAQHDDITGKFHWEIIRDQKFDGFIKGMLQKKRGAVEELELSGKTYQCNGIFLSTRDELVLTMSDMTETRKLERIKKNFVSNVSHELRTPLTSIKGFIETLEDDRSADHRDYIGIIKRNTDRLIAIVNDLLTLSELENQKTTGSQADVDLKRLLLDVIDLFAPLIENKGIELNLSTDPRLPTIKGDVLELEQMLSNLIDNAVKYTEKGVISLTLSRVEKGISIKVSDTGIGIPEKDLDRIFERFYVVNKSRSRKSGGTGLGLSIVKHIVQRHRGEITVESAAGKGTLFTVVLPV